MKSTLKILEKPKIFRETGSAFDATEIEKIKQRAGGHDVLPKRQIDITAFSYSKRTNKHDTNDFLKKKTGTGGTLVSHSYIMPI